ncbi:MAG: protein kinase [Verrucomicrobia bacterium]|nr:protein kinase [Verrucomicrobiota bacterium]
MYLALFLALSLACGQLGAETSVKQQAEKDIQSKRYDQLGRLIKRNLGDKITLTELQAIAKEHNAQPVLDAIDATRKIKKYHTNLSLKRSDIMQTALFIETALPKLVKKKKTFLSKNRSGLAHAVEYDPELKSSFIVLDSKDTFIGAGAYKKVYKAIHYNHTNKHPKVVARAVQKTKQTREHAITKKMHGAPGLFETVGFGCYRQRSKHYRTIYSKLYRPGSLHSVLEKRTHLSLYEKMKIASDILKGLSALHKKGIVHRDLGARNYFVDIPKGRPGRREVKACIADLGRATQAKKAGNTKVQGNTKYTAPEGLYRRNMHGKEYYKADVYAVGCVLYWLFHGKMAHWQDRSYVKDAKGSLYHRYKQLRNRIKHGTKWRRQYLVQKGSKKTAKEYFEQMILQMLHTTARKRGTAHELSKRMDKIFEAAYG